MNTPPATNGDLLTLGQAARRVGIDLWQAQRLVDRGSIPHLRIGRNRVIRVADLGSLRDAAARAGWIEAETAAAGA